MKIFLRFAQSALHYKARLIVAILCIAGTNLFQFASLGTMVPFADRILSGKEIKVPASVYDVAPQRLCALIDLVVRKLNPVSYTHLTLPTNREV